MWRIIKAVGGWLDDYFWGIVKDALIVAAIGFALAAINFITDQYGFYKWSNVAENVIKTINNIMEIEGRISLWVSLICLLCYIFRWGYRELKNMIRW